LDEDETRLPPGVAPEILRIAQEAVANARRHSQARTLWVTYRVTEGGAFLRVADDGRGIPEGRGRPDSFGLQIMRERAARIGASLTVKRRSPNGTVVELSLQTGSGPREVER
ncbi:MAG: sensor histidine kinase, partial [Actinomycetota bacterium]